MIKKLILGAIFLALVIWVLSITLPSSPKLKDFAIGCHSNDEYIALYWHEFVDHRVEYKEDGTYKIIVWAKDRNYVFRCDQNGIWSQSVRRMTPEELNNN